MPSQVTLWTQTGWRQMVWDTVPCSHRPRLSGQQCWPWCFLIVDNETTTLTIHVDDCLITGGSPELIADYKHKLNQCYSLMNLGPVHLLLGIKITHNCKAHTISLSQMAYIDTILFWFLLSDAKPIASLISPSTTLSKANAPSDATKIAQMKKIPHCEAVGSLMYATVATCPGIPFTILTLSQFLENPGLIHWEAIKHVLSYISGTKTYAFTVEM